MSKKPKTKNFGISQNHYPKVHREVVDQDYVQKLSPSEKEWLAKFNREYVGGSFDETGNLHDGASFTEENLAEAGLTVQKDWHGYWVRDRSGELISGPFKRRKEAVAAAKQVLIKRKVWQSSYHRRYDVQGVSKIHGKQVSLDGCITSDRHLELYDGYVGLTEGVNYEEEAAIARIDAKSSKKERD